ncbi:5564_t:CDS:2 [Racocetra fulgida]|uniref:5564_t:CDS:1 n=1 Tax=Racocetra fulgida TaxID=60492 RepID=A0A9N9FH64_9GLOM|nr:5564_t:CDS:2 [Racocetra fulgida]
MEVRQEAQKDYESEMFDYQKAANRDNINISNVNKSEEKDVIVSIAKNDEMYKMNEGEPEYSSDLNDEIAQKSEVAGELDNEVSEDEMIVLMKAPLDVITKLDILMEGLVETLKK